MTYTNCDHCKKARVPLNDTAKIDANTYCAACIDENFATREQLKGKLIEKHTDPTICTNCQKDNGSIPLNKLASYPVCDDCAIAIQNRVFPKWVKAFGAFILLLVVFAFAWNWRFYQSYRSIKQSNIFAVAGDYEKAAALMKEAAGKTPEVDDVATLYAFYSGIAFMAKDKSTEALEEFNKCKNALPPDFNINNWIIKARIGASFDNKDYDGFLAATQENLRLDTTAGFSYASVASAYACMYAINGKDSFKLAAEKNLQRAQALDTTKEVKDYANMIEYRIYSREIIRSEDFEKKYPTGWIKN